MKTEPCPCKTGIRTSTEFNQNPYWLTNRVTSNDKRFRTLAALSANLKINDWFSIQARGNVDYINDNYEQKMYAGTAADVAHQNGRYIKNEPSGFHDLR